jgi:hypothetical protein
MVYGVDERAEQLNSQATLKQPRSVYEFNVYQHEAQFSPGKTNHGNSLNPYPPYLSPVLTTPKPSKRQREPRGSVGLEAVISRDIVLPFNPAFQADAAA